MHGLNKGTEKEVKSNKGRQRVNINGSYSPDEGILKDFENLYNTSAKLFAYYEFFTTGIKKDKSEIMRLLVEDFHLFNSC